MAGRFTTFSIRALVIALLLLAVSPVTAPFSTYDLRDLFGTVPTGAALVHTKTAADETVASLSALPDLPVILGATLESRAAVVRHTRGARPLRIPLRI